MKNVLNELIDSAINRGKVFLTSLKEFFKLLSLTILNYCFAVQRQYLSSEVLLKIRNQASIVPAITIQSSIQKEVPFSQVHLKILQSIKTKKLKNEYFLYKSIKEAIYECLQTVSFYRSVYSCAVSIALKETRRKIQL